MRILRLFNALESSSDDDNDERVIEEIRRKRYRERINFDFIRDREFIQRFRISRSSAEQVLNVIGPHIKHKTKRNKALSPKQQLLVALHFFGNGSQFHGIGDMHGIDASTVCRTTKRVVKALLNTLFQKFVRWPNHTADIDGRFYFLAEFPHIAGVVDGTLIQIDAPSENESAYVDRHGNHSLNVMLVCGPNEQFYYASAKWPGSVHDNRVLRNSSLYEMWEIQGTTMRVSTTFYSFYSIH